MSVFDRVDFREGAKKKKKKKTKKGRENEEENFFGRCLARRQRWERDGGAWVFSPLTNQKVFSPKWGENQVGGSLIGKR